MPTICLGVNFQNDSNDDVLIQTYKNVTTNFNTIIEIQLELSPDR